MTNEAQYGRFDDVAAFLAAAPQGRAWIGLDLGTKTLGVAITDRTWAVARPAHVIPWHKFSQAQAALRTFVDAEDIGAIVLGLPYNMNGSEGPRAQATRGFARNLSRAWGADMPPLLYFDERLTSEAAERAMRQADMTQKARAARIDAVAAAIILHSALERIRLEPT